MEGKPFHTDMPMHCSSGHLLSLQSKHNGFCQPAHGVAEVDCADHLNSPVLLCLQCSIHTPSQDAKDTGHQACPAGSSRLTRRKLRPHRKLVAGHGPQPASIAYSGKSCEPSLPSVVSVAAILPAAVGLFPALAAPAKLDGGGQRGCSATGNWPSECLDFMPH